LDAPLRFVQCPQRRLSPRETTSGRSRKASPKDFQSDAKMIDLDALVAGLELG
jgi:hypothetical protein